ncbi:PKD domain-containing protein [Algoriphagus aquaeductus]|uniref:PKD domain-containing protein n=1 Tax=Algoriphagus aquaeductus TaxID=475299 RepID=UPI0015EBD763|nr:PKD domain-containing protein [Algoriphagus aquaeductus]
MKNPSRIYILLILILISKFPSFSQTVAIPRDGFPYCEPFTNSTTRANTFFQGVPKPAILTANEGLDPEGDGFLRLTDNNLDQRGYMFIDLPFSPVYGIKVSFEYFAYGGLTITPADGISFFMFDGAITPSTFQIGGLGGSLGYSPWRSNSGLTFQPGLKGAYLGIGFDAFRNFGNEYEGRYGGFKDPTATGFGPVPDERQYYNSIVIRGPETSNYQFIDGKRTFDRSFLNEQQPAVYTDPIDSKYYLFDPLDPVDYFNRRFTLASPLRAETCGEPGYRKVFIDLAPTGSGTYILNVSMLYNNGTGLFLQPIFTNVPYNFPAPQNIKLGFAASTGSPNTNFHEIRNVTAEVSDYASIPIPEIENLSAEVCEGEENLFEFEVDLKSENSFLRCVQLYETDPGAPDNSPPTGGNPSLTNCGLSNVCVERCDPANNTRYLPGKGTFSVELEELTSDNFEDEKYAASIRFVPDPGFIGTAQVYYQVVDNYGLISFAKTITVTTNPEPIKIQDPQLDNPTCNGQADGLISNLIVGDLVPGFDYEWYYNGSSIGKLNASVSPLVGGEAIFSISGINLGTYTLTVWNPSDLNGCSISIDVEVSQEQGTPVDLLANDKEICEGNAVDFYPVIPPIYGSDAGAKFFWYTSPNRLGGPITNGATRVIDGQTVTFSIVDDREIIITGLVANGSNPKDYIFYVEAQSKTNPSGNFCPYIGDVISEARVKVFPPLNFSASVVSEDWCSDGKGEIQALISNPLSSVTYFLEDGNGNPISSNSSGQFTGLAIGSYQVYASSSSPNCITSIIPLSINGPSQPLTLAETSIQNAFCGNTNGVLSFNLTGGVGPYTILLNGSALSGASVSGNTYTVQNLAAGNYTILVTDSKGCTETLDSQLGLETNSEFDTNDDEICEGEEAILQSVIVNQSTSSPVFEWYIQDSSGNFLKINSGQTVNGVLFTIDSNNDLRISGLLAQNSPYTYYLKVTGDRVCDQGYIPASVIVNSLPELDIPEIKNVSCYGGDDASIQVKLKSGNFSDFEFNLIGNNGFNSGWISNSGLFTGLEVGKYTLTVRNLTGCQTQVTDLDITEPTEMTVQEDPNSHLDASCGLDNGEFTFSISGGVPNAAGEYKVKINGIELASYSGSITRNSSSNFTLEDLAPGNYTIEVADENGCVQSLVVSILDTPVPQFDVMSVEVCEKVDAILKPVIVSAASGVSPIYIWSYEDPSNPGSLVSINSGDQVGEVAYTIQNGELIISGLAFQPNPYLYYLTVSGSMVCDGPPIPAEVKIIKLPEAEFETKPVSCFGGNDGAIDLLSSNPGSNLTFTLVGYGQSNSTGTFSGLEAGTYSVSIEDAIGCAYIETVEITEPSAPIQINTPDILRSSCDLNNGSIENLLISGGWGNYSVEWRKGSLTGQVIAGDLVGAKDLGPGNYFLFVTDSQGCSETFTFTVQESSDPNYGLVPPMDVCFGETVQIRPVHLAPNPSLPPVAPTEVKWFTDPNQTGLIQDGQDPNLPTVSYLIDDSDWLNPELLITGLPPGLHDFYFYVACTGQELKIEVTVYEKPEVVLETKPVSCFGDNNGKIKVISGGKSNYTYSINGGPVINQTALETFSFTSGIYNLTVITPGGCPQNSTFEIEGPTSALSATPLTKTDPGCGASNGKLQLTVTGGWLPYSVEVVRNGASLETKIFNTSSVDLIGYTIGDYQLIITDAQGCKLTSNSVSLLDGPTQILIEKKEICEGELAVLSPTLDPPSSGVTFQWYFDQTLAQPISSSPNPAADGKIYQINPTTGVLSVSNLNGQAVPYTYFVTVSGGTVCPGFVGKGEVLVYSIPSATAIVENEICFGDGGKITVNVAGAPGIYTYSLNGGPFVNTNVFQVATGVHHVEVKNLHGCSYMVSPISVTGPTSPLASSGINVNNPTCGTDNGEINFTISGGYSPYQILYARNGESPLNINQAGPGQVTISNLPLGNYEIDLVDAQGCVINVTSNLLLEEAPTVIYVQDKVICQGETAELLPVLPPNITNPSYSWFFDAGGENPILNGQLNGINYSISTNGTLTIDGLTGSNAPYTYYVSASGPGICNLTPEPVEIKVNSIPTLRVSNPSIVCDPKGTVDLTRFIEGFNPNVYDYNIISPNGTAMLIEDIDEVNLSGDYRVSSSLKGASCWNPFQRIRVQIADELLVANFQYDVDPGTGIIISNGDIGIFEDVFFKDMSLGKAIIWNWDFGDGNTSSQKNPKHQFQEKGDYTVSLQVIDTFGCISNYQIIVNVNDDYLVIIPNAFTPDGLKNQKFRPYYKGISKLEFYIFSTWGELIYRSDSMEDPGWDGSLNGKPAMPGNYIFKGRFVSRSGEVFEKAGTFILIR